MRRRFAPTHDILARMRYVPEDDSAWKRDLIDKECATHSEQFDHDTGHIYWRYFAGVTRYDLDDPQLAPYIDFDAKPETWRFKRLPREIRDDITFMIRQGRTEPAWAMAFAHATTGLDNPGNPLGEHLAALLAASPKERTDEQRREILKAAEDYSAGAIYEVGAAAFRGSQDLTRQEKKA
jgi:hypothetical protein